MANIILLSTNQIADILYAKDKYIQTYGTLCYCYLFLSIEPSIFIANLSQQFTYIHVCLLSVFLNLHLRDLTETEMISKIQMQNKTNDFELNT